MLASAAEGAANVQLSDGRLAEGGAEQVGGIPLTRLLCLNIPTLPERNCAMDGIRVPAVMKQAPWEPCARRGSKPSDSSMTSRVQNPVAAATNAALSPHRSFSLCLALTRSFSPGRGYAN